MIGNKIANKIAKVYKNSQQKNSEIVTATNDHDKETPKNSSRRKTVTAAEKI